MLGKRLVLVLVWLMFLCITLQSYRKWGRVLNREFL